MFFIRNVTFMTNKTRERSIYKVTLAGGAINVALVIFKFTAGIIGGSAAMIADAVHSLSDFLTDIVVLIFVHISNKPQDEDHDYGHGKYETLATSIIGLALLAVGILIFYNGLTKVLACIHGTQLHTPGAIAFWAAILSIVFKEFAYQFTVKVGKQVDSQAVIANAWHHRSDAFSSIGTAIGIGGAILLGKQWTVLDPIAAIIVSFFIVKVAWKLTSSTVDELLEKSLPKEVEDEIKQTVMSEDGVSELHHLRTRRIGNHYAIEMHIRMPGEISLFAAHSHASSIEKRIKEQYGEETHVGIHVEPVKINGVYESPSKLYSEEDAKDNITISPLCNFPEDKKK